MSKIGITEGSDAALDPRWQPWVKAGKPAILITKNPRLLLEQLAPFDGSKIIVHATITGNGGSILEPQVPENDHSLNALPGTRGPLGAPTHRPPH